MKKEYGLYQYYITTSTTTESPYDRGANRFEDVELDDTAPLPLFIGIGLALFIGFVILVLICCFCRRRRVPSAAPPDRPINASHYQRAPVADGIGVGVAYPLSSVPTMPYPNSSVVYPPPHMGPMIQHNYGVIGAGVNYNGANHYPQQPPHFGGVPAYPPNHYMATLPMAPHTTPLQSHSPSHSSQASSSVSGATADPLVPSPSPFLQLQQQQHLQQQLQQHHHHPQQLHQFPHQQHISPAVAFQHHQHMQQQFLGGRQSPALQYSQITYSTVSLNEHNAPPKTDCVATTAPTVTSSQINRPQVNHQPPQVVDQSAANYKEKDEE
ncbi:unnamed protein product [Candidula unifasciata]|uniref:Uncharacterized protein n=1 Tax=Candidula unifasciata TaxID=100452 RepID=A0A8S3ZN97_9EUPU|nr:unnamed protein product [Candidula unifasciata]